MLCFLLCSGYSLYLHDCIVDVHGVLQMEAARLWTLQSGLEKKGNNKGGKRVCKEMENYTVECFGRGLCAWRCAHKEVLDWEPELLGDEKNLEIKGDPPSLRLYRIVEKLEKALEITESIHQVPPSSRLSSHGPKTMTIQQNHSACSYSQCDWHEKKHRKQYCGISSGNLLYSG